MASSTVEDYIKQIYLLSERIGHKSVPMGQVATALCVVPGTATTMVKALADAGLVRYAPRVGVELTRQGTVLALHVLRRHRLVEQFLVEVLDFDWSEVHDEAERLEHAISDALLERIDKYLGRPKEDPHGDPIPDAAGVVGKEAVVPLADCCAGDEVVVARVRDQDATFLQYIANSHLSPGARLRVEAVNPSADAVEVRRLDVKTKPVLAMGLSAAAKLDVRRRA